VVHEATVRHTDALANRPTVVYCQPVCQPAITI